MSRTTVVALIVSVSCEGSGTDPVAAQAAGYAIADAVENGRRLASLHPEHMRWLLGPGGWSATDVSILETEMETTRLTYELVELEQRGRRKPLEFAQLIQTPSGKRWSEQRRRLQQIRDAFHRGDGARAKQLLYAR